MNEQLYKYIKDILKDGDMEELGKVMDVLMADKDDSEQFGIMKGLLENGIISYLIGKELRLLVCLYFSCKAPSENTEGINLQRMMMYAAFVGYTLGSIADVNLLDDELQYDEEKAAPVVNLIYENLTEEYPAIVYLDEFRTAMLLYVISMSIKYAVEFLTKGELMDMMFCNICPDWKYHTGLSDEETEKLYERMPFCFPEDQERVNLKFQCFEMQHRIVSSCKDLHEYYSSYYNINEPEIATMIDQVLALKNSRMQFKEIKPTYENVLTLPFEEHCSIFLAYTAKRGELMTEEDAYDCCMTSYAMYDVLREIVQHKEIEDLSFVQKQIAYGVVVREMLGFLNYPLAMQKFYYVEEHIKNFAKLLPTDGKREERARLVAEKAHNNNQ